jgi:ABC-2 type transport system ATP-binding protein
MTRSRAEALRGRELFANLAVSCAALAFRPPGGRPRLRAAARTARIPECTDPKARPEHRRESLAIAKSATSAGSPGLGSCAPVSTRVKRTMIETRQLVKRYGDLVAVDGISFKVEPGQVLGFLGPNGAGKSTTMKMLAGFLAPTSGSASVGGFDVEKQPLEAKRVLGYLPEGAPSYGEMTVREFLEFIADVRGLSGERRDQRLDDAIARLHLERVLEQPIDTLSKGFKRRVGLAQAILHDPAVLILDEPTDGLDPNQKHEVRTLINAMARDKTIIVSTHLLEEVHAVCTRAIIIAAGRILADATPAELEARSRYHQAVSLTAENVGAAKDALARVADVAAIEVDPQDGRITAFPKPGRAIFVAVSDALKSQGVAVRELALEGGRLDEVFRTVTQGATGKEART